MVTATRTPRTKRRSRIAPSRRPRLADVALAAGVSTMTVVRVLREPAKVAAATRTRVERVIRETGYTPDLIARGLASNRSGLIAAVIPVLTNSLIAEIIQGLTDALAPKGFHLLLGASGFSAGEEEVLVRAFLSRRVDGIYLSGVEHSAETVRMLRRAGIPVVEGGNLTTHPIDMLVGFSNVDAARTITRYLVQRRYASIGYIGAFPKDNDRARDRRNGYEQAMKAGRRRIDPGLCEETAPRRACGVLLGRRARRRRALRMPAAWPCHPARRCDRGLRRHTHRGAGGSRVDDDPRAALRDRPARRRHAVRAPGRRHDAQARHRHRIRARTARKRVSWRGQHRGDALAAQRPVSGRRICVAFHIAAATTPKTRCAAAVIQSRVTANHGKISAKPYMFIANSANPNNAPAASDARHEARAITIERQPA
jgi:LacI family transcriptional regulator, gluconate utilization system Gnt-I transcriptional repressor